MNALIHQGLCTAFVPASLFTNLFFSTTSASPPPASCPHVQLNRGLLSGGVGGRRRGRARGGGARPGQAWFARSATVAVPAGSGYTLDLRETCPAGPGTWAGGYRGGRIGQTPRRCIPLFPPSPSPSPVNPAFAPTSGCTLAPQPHRPSLSPAPPSSHPPSRHCPVLSLPSGPFHDPPPARPRRVSFSPVLTFDAVHQQ